MRSTLLALFAILSALATQGCVTPPVSRSLEPLYDAATSRHVELLGGDAEAVWLRAREVFAEHELAVRVERFAEGQGVFELKPFIREAPGRVSRRYKPARVVAGAPHESVKLHHALSLHLSASETGLVRLWFEGEVSVDGRPASEVVPPDVVPHRLLQAIVEPFPVVKTWLQAP